MNHAFFFLPLVYVGKRRVQEALLGQVELSERWQWLVKLRRCRPCMSCRGYRSSLAEESQINSAFWQRGPSIPMQRR